MSTIRECLIWGTGELRERSGSARLDAELLLSHVLSISRTQLLTNLPDQIEPSAEHAFQKLVERRKNYEPIAYITGEREFFGLSFTVTPSVLIPRPETELLVEQALKIAATHTHPPDIVDLGTGSGCIAVSIAYALKQAGRKFTLLAIDKSGEALEVAAQNARRHGVDEEIRFVQSDWFAAIPEDCKFDLLLANPPYISANASLPQDLHYEPKAALFSGADGLDAIRKLLQSFTSRAKPQGEMLVEIGCDQADAISTLCARSGQAHRILEDLAKLPRLLCVQAAQ